ncbi:MAG: ribonuclease III [Deltaproteobacteria bacterium]|jgi:UDP-N-acetylmuramate: L-alanyl-gamma-D-glutamyl-meso-diaminopimelate ligase|nr:ribonuclease III [Deltaproteobacteria bacterium]
MTSAFPAADSEAVGQAAPEAAGEAFFEPSAKPSSAPLFEPSPETPLDPRLNRLPDDFGPGRRVCLLGAAGVAMASLGGLLLADGLEVYGVDRDVYPPASELLERLGLPVHLDWGPEGLEPRPDLAVVGNVVTKRFPTLPRLRERQIPYLSLPQTLSRLFLNQTKNLVVAGCHGKTTATDFAAFLFERGGFAPGWLIGGDSLDFSEPFRRARGEWFVIEGDEYDCAFYDKYPKFLHYRPQTVILTSVEFDHADIYADLAAVKAAYRRLVELLPADGLLLGCGDDPAVREIASLAPCRTVFYGLGSGCQWRASAFAPQGFGSTFTLKGPVGRGLKLTLPRPGLHNALNAAAAAAAFLEAGGAPEAVAPALAAVRGVRRRQEVLGRWGELTLIDDFAHHPTAVAATLAALRAARPGRRLLAVFEPRSNTTRRGVFQKLYAQSLQQADRVFLAPIDRPEKAPEGDRLDLPQLAAELGGASTPPDLDALAAAVAAEARDGDVVVLMSNGGFGGLGAKLAGLFEARGPQGEPPRSAAAGRAKRVGRAEQAAQAGQVGQAPQSKPRPPKRLKSLDSSPDASEAPQSAADDKGSKNAADSDDSDRPVAAVSRLDQSPKSPTAPNDEFAHCRVLSQTLRHEFKNLRLLRAALTHRSRLGEPFAKTEDETDNQRLEFLGDSVLGLRMAELLFALRPRLKEGEMSRLRAHLVCETRLAEVARDLELGSYLTLGQGEITGGGRNKPSVLADAMEAVLAAVYLDGGFQAAGRLVERLWRPYFEHARALVGFGLDSKTQLQEVCQKFRLGPPAYRAVRVSGPPHSSVFTMSVEADGLKAEAEGGSKKEAEQEAAKILLELLSRRLGVNFFEPGAMP